MMGGGGDRGAGDREKRGREVYGRKGRRGGGKRDSQGGGKREKKREKLRNIAQYFVIEKCKGAGDKKIQGGNRD